MKRRPFLSLFPAVLLRATLIAVFLAGCAPAASPVSPGQPAPVEPGSTILPPTSTQGSSAPATVAPTDALLPSPLPAATSRGPDLHASDPATVNLASGGLQLVEFFRFT